MVAQHTLMSSVIPWFDVPVIDVLGMAVDLPAVLAVGGGLVALTWCRRAANRAGLSPRRAVDALALAMLSALCFGRLTEVVYYPDQLARDWRILLPWRGGYTSLGVLLGAALALALCFRSSDREVRWRYLDVLAPAALLGASVVRIGCFLGHHHAGRLTNIPVAVAFPGGARFDLGLLEALLLLAIFTGVDRWRVRPGHVALVSVTVYAVGRFAIELLRGHDLELIGRRSDPRYLGLTLVQYATMVIAGLGGVWLWRRRPREAPVLPRVGGERPTRGA
jgi:phosphatidylglycerol---prolipoprotein diacylglyceryl transferase